MWNDLIVISLFLKGLILGCFTACVFRPIAGCGPRGRPHLGWFKARHQAVIHHQKSPVCVSESSRRRGLWNTQPLSEAERLGKLSCLAHPVSFFRLIWLRRYDHPVLKIGCPNDKNRKKKLLLVVEPVGKFLHGSCAMADLVFNLFT